MNTNIVLSFCAAGIPNRYDVKQATQFIILTKTAKILLYLRDEEISGDVSEEEEDLLLITRSRFRPL